MGLRRLQLALSSAAVAAAFLALAAGCGGVGNKADDPQYVTVCSDKAVTGSHVSRTRCHRKIDAEERERRDRRFMEQMQHESVRRPAPLTPASP